MKRLIALMLSLLLCLSFLVGCGKKEEDEDITEASEKNMAVVSNAAMPPLDSSLLTDDAYQIFPLENNVTLFQLNNFFSQRLPLFTPAVNQLTFRLDLTNSSQKAKEYTLALWESDGSEMIYLDSYYIPADDQTYTCTFTGLSSEKSYRPIITADKGDGSGRISVTDGYTDANAPLEEEEEEETV